MGLLLLSLLQYESQMKKAMKAEQGFIKKERVISLLAIGGVGVLLVGIFAPLNMFTGIGGF
jgi:hypothetical protein